MAEVLGVETPADFPSRFRAAAVGGVLLLQCCRTCGMHNPLSVTDLCHNCGSVDLQIAPASGRCTLLSHTYVVRPSDAGEPRTAVFVELDEGVRLLGVALSDVRMEFDARLQFAYRDEATGMLLFGEAVTPEPGRSIPGADARAAG
jgi:uncharacterized OB-fold protein